MTKPKDKKSIVKPDPGSTSKLAQFDMCKRCRYYATLEDKELYKRLHKPEEVDFECQLLKKFFNKQKIQEAPIFCDPKYESN